MSPSGDITTSRSDVITKKELSMSASLFSKWKIFMDLIAPLNFCPQCSKDLVFISVIRGHARTHYVVAVLGPFTLSAFILRPVL